MRKIREYILGKSTKGYKIDFLNVGIKTEQKERKVLISEACSNK